MVPLPPTIEIFSLISSTLLIVTLFTCTNIILLVGVVSRDIVTLVPLQQSELVALRVVLGQLTSVALVPELEIIVPTVEAIPITVPAWHL